MKILILSALLVALCTGLKPNEVLVRFREVRSLEADPLPEVLKVTLEHSSSRRDADLPSSLHLVRNDKVHLTQFEEDGVPVEANLDDVGFYLDHDNQAVITAKLHKVNDNTVRTLRGSFVKDGVAYEVEPVHATLEVEAKRAAPLPMDAHNHVVRLMFNSTTDLRPKVVREVIADLEDKLDLTRRSADPYVVENIWLTDYEFYKEWTAIADHTKSNLKEFFAHQITGMDLAYYSLQQMGLDVEIQVKKVIITTQSTTKLPTDNSKIRGRTNPQNQNRQSIDPDKVLDLMEGYRKTKGYTWYNPDHLTLFTGFDLDQAPVGVAPLAGICQAERGVSTVELTGWHMWAVIAHELGHNLGMEHDGVNGCYEDGNIMSPMVVKLWELTNVDKAYKFSTCNKRQAKACLEGTDKRKFPRICLKSTTCNDFKFTTKPNKLPGQIDDLDKQCKIQFGTDSDAGETCGSHKENADNCKKLMCRKGNMCYYGRASNGSPCGVGKWCIQGKCVTTNNKPANHRPNCVTKGSIPTPGPGCTNTHHQCDQVFDNPSNCDDVYFQEKCCRVCTPYGF